MARPPVISIGNQDFASIRERGNFYVDKTGFIREWWDSDDVVTLITRPRRFGKTLNMSMLAYFFSPEYAGREDLFRGLDIWKDQCFRNLQGQIPVVSISLAGVKGTNYEDARKGIVQLIVRTFQQYVHLLGSPSVTDVDQELFQAVNLSMDDATLATSLNLLCYLLEKSYGQKPIVLIDEYDTPLEQAYVHGFWQQMVNLTQPLFNNTFKTNPHLLRGLMTGVTRVSKESIFSDLNNLQVDSVLDTNFPEAFGFTEPEIKQLGTDLGYQASVPEIKDWYDGYRLQGREIYNPWSVLQYFANGCEPRPYWVNTSGNAILAELMRAIDDEHAATLESLLQGGSVQAFLREGVIYSDIGDDEDALYTLLVTTGYLTVAGEQRIGYETQYDLCLPNKEMQSLFADEILRRFRHYQKKSALVRLMQALLAGDAEKAQTGLSKFLVSMVSAFDTGAKESFYHGFVLGMTAILVPDYEVQSNREAGRGRFDVAVFPKDMAKPGLLFEFKTAASESELADKADEALQQMAERDYLAPFRARGIGQVHQYGVAFCGKQVYLKKMYK